MLINSLKLINLLFSGCDENIISISSSVAEIFLPCSCSAQQTSTSKKILNCT